MNQKVTAEMIKTLREMTGCGLLECKQSLETAGGNIDAAIDIMRKSGQAKALKKETRVANDGVIGISVSADSKNALMVEINCETDFVSRSDNFKNFVNTILTCGLENNAKTLEEFLKLYVSADKTKTVEDLRQALIAQVGENIQIRNLFLMQSENSISHYLHGTRIGVLVDISTKDDSLGKDIAMHIAAYKPNYLSGKDVPDSEIQHEREIYLAQILSSGKSQEIAEKIVVGKLEKFVKENTLFGQPFVKDPSITVGDLLKKQGSEVKSFVRFELGNCSK